MHGNVLMTGVHIRLITQQICITTRTFFGWDSSLTCSTDTNNKDVNMKQKGLLPVFCDLTWASCHFENWPCNCLSLLYTSNFNSVKTCNLGFKCSSFKEINLFNETAIQMQTFFSCSGSTICLSVLLARCSTWQGGWLVRKEWLVGPLWQCFEMCIN